MKYLELLADTEGLSISTNITHLNGACCDEGVPDSHATKVIVSLIQWTWGSKACRLWRNKCVDTLNLFDQVCLQTGKPRGKSHQWQEDQPSACLEIVNFPHSHQREPQGKLLFQKPISLSWMRSLWSLDTRPVLIITLST